MQPPQGLVDKVRGLKKLKSIADSLPKTVSRGAVPGGRAHRRRGRPRPAADPALLARRPGAVHHAAGRDHEGPAHGRPQRRHVPDAEDRLALDLHALADPQGRARRLPRDRRDDPGRRRARARPGHGVLGERAAAEAHRRVDARRLPPRRAGRAGQGEDGRPRGAGERRDRARGLRSRRARSGWRARSATTPATTRAAEPFPVFRLSAITMRRDAIYPSIVVGKPPQEDAWLGKATERIFLPAVKMTVPEIVDYDLPVAGAFHNCVIVSIRKAFPGHAHKVMHAIWGLGMLSLSKSVVVVDAHVNVHDYDEVFFYVGANVDPEARRRARRGPARPPRPRADAAVRRRQARHRRDREGAGRGRARVAGGDRDERRDQGARRPPLGRVRHTGARSTAQLGREWRTARVAAAVTSLTGTSACRLNHEGNLT